MIFLSVKPILQYIENMIVSASKGLHFKSNISLFSETFYTNFLHEYINSFEIELATWNSLLLRRSCSLILFSLLQRNVLNPETEGTLLLRFSNILGNGELPCFALHLLSYFMEGNKILRIARYDDFRGLADMSRNNKIDSFGEKIPQSVDCSIGFSLIFSSRRRHSPNHSHVNYCYI